MRNLAKKERLLESVKGLHKDTLDILQMDVTDRMSILNAQDKVVEKRVDILGMLLNNLCYYAIRMHLNSAASKTDQEHDRFTKRDQTELCSCSVRLEMHCLNSLVLVCLSVRLVLGHSQCVTPVLA